MTPGWTAIFSLFLMVMGFITVFLSYVDRETRRAKANGGKVEFTRANLLEPLGLFLSAIGLLILCILVMARGWFWVMEVPFQLFVGWLLYFGRVCDDVNPAPWSVVSGVVCIVGVVIGSHYFLRWLASTASRPWPLKRTLQLLLLVVMMFVVGVAFTGLVQQTGWLIRTPDPLTKDNRSLR